MRSVDEADLDRLAEALAQLLATFWRKRVGQERAADRKSAAEERGA